MGTPRLKVCSVQNMISSEMHLVLKLSSGNLPHVVVSAKENIYYISLHPTLLKGFKIKITELSAVTGNSIDRSLSLASDSEIASEELILYTGANYGVPFLIWVDKGLKNLRMNIIGTGQIAHFTVPSHDGQTADRVTIHAPRSPKAKAQVLLQYQGAESHWAEVYHFTSGAIKQAYNLPQLKGKGTFSATSYGPDVYFIRHTAFETTLISSEDSAILNQWSNQPAGYNGYMDPQEVNHAVSEVIPRGASLYAVRSALALPTGDWQLIRNGELFWVRPEGLTGVVAAAFVDIPEAETLAKELAAEGQNGLFAAYVNRVKRHAKDLQHLPVWAESLSKRLLANLTRGKVRQHAQGVHRDGFGFRKFMLVATESGRLAALDVGKGGTVVWNIQAVALEFGQRWEILSIEAEEGTVMVQGLGGEFFRVVSNTGALQHYRPQGTTPLSKTSVPVRGALGNNILVPVNDDGTLGNIPSLQLSPGTVIVTQGLNNGIKGWTLSRTSKPVLLWSFAPAVGEQVKTISIRPTHDPVASIGKALGDRNVLYKHMNQNLVLVTTVAGERSIASFYLLDSTSGEVIYSTSHSGVDVSRPMVPIISENWFAYSLFGEVNFDVQGATQNRQKKLQGYQLIISELYESPYPNDRGSLDPSLNSTSIFPLAKIAGEALETPHVVSQTFLIPGPISSMSVTSTLQGITTRSLLCVLSELNSIISISRAFVDPRRPISRDPTAAEMEEGLFRYNPILDFEPKWVLNHKRDILSVSKIVTSPSLLESTSLVFAFGDIDLFGTRTAPIGAFDILGKGFSKVQLVLTVVALAIGTTLVAPFVSYHH